MTRMWHATDHNIPSHALRDVMGVVVVVVVRII